MLGEVDSLNIDVVGKASNEITIESFLKIAKQSLAILRDLDDGNTLTWRLQEAHINSPLHMTWAAYPKVENFNRRVSTRYLHLLRWAEYGGPRPQHLNPKVAMRVKDLVHVFDDGVASVVFSSRHDQSTVSPTATAKTSVDEFIAEYNHQYKDFIIIEGKLGTVTVHNREGFHIYDLVTDHKIECDIPKDRLEEAKNLLGGYVWVYGETSFKNDKPYRMKASDFGRMTPDSELPNFRDVQGINITGGITSEEYVRRMRDSD